MATDNTRQRFNLSFAKVKAFGDSENPTPRITCTASSDAVDLGTDRFLVSALRQMQETFPGMTIFLNHKYSVPEDVFGVVKNAHIVERNGHYDLDLDIEVDINNERAMVTYQQIRSGARLGVSVGVLVLDAESSVEIIDGQKVKVLNIKSVETLEASIVGIPANRRSWVQGALKAASYVVSAEYNGGAEMATENEDEIPGLTEIEQEEPVIAPSAEDEDDKKPNPFEKKKPGEDAPDKKDEQPDPDDVEDDESDEDEDDEEEADDEESDSAPATPVAEEATPATTPDEEADDEEPALASVLSPRAQVVATLRKAVSDPDRDWFTIKEVDVEGDDGPQTVTEVLIYDAIGDGIGAKDFVQQLDNIKSSRINVRLNSPGGVITDGIAIRNALARHSADVYTYVDGIAASMASVIALVGKECVMEPESMLMIHEPWGCQMGNAGDMEREARILNKYGNSLAGAYARKAGGTKEEWRDVMREEGWYTPEEAVDAGLVDRVGTNSDESEDYKKLKNASFDKGILGLFKRAPESVGRFFTAEAPVEHMKTADVGDLTALASGVSELTKSLTASNTENVALRTKVADLQAQIKQRDVEAAEVGGIYAEILDYVERLKNAPLPRKITPEATFTALSEKYAWLDPRIVAQLARNAEPD